MPAKRPVRRSQLISPWGIGHMINFPKDESLMVAGLDLWEDRFRSLNNVDEFRIKEERLARRLGVTDFRQPPDFRDPNHGVENPSLMLPFVRFPRWHYCARCGHMEQLSIYEPQKPTCPGTRFSSGRNCADLAPNRRPRLIPVRFIAICQRGHIQDFPFRQWVHNGIQPECVRTLRLRAGRSSGTLSGIQISCECGAHKTMAGAFNDQALTRIGVTCSGDRPWLGEEFSRGNTTPCSEPLLVVQKGASNVYFPHVRSSIYLPQWEQSVDRRIVEVLEKNWRFLTNALDNGEFSRPRFEVIADYHFPAAQGAWYVDKMLQAAEHRLNNSPQLDISDSEESYRRMEYEAILAEAGGENQDFYVTKKHVNEYNNQEEWAVIQGFSSIGLLHKIRETRALIGFTRWLPESNSTIEEKKNNLMLSRQIDWLPAIVVRGEGVFFEFSRREINAWAERPEVSARVATLARNYNRARNNRRQLPRPITPQFLLIHTFAHIIINQFSFECGYGSSSLKERIYCNLESEDGAMHGVLIYTASGDAEGSLGGLVKQGKPGNLEKIVYNAIENARWCSGDPVCIDSRGQGPNSCNLAACHNCALLPETCCEESNTLLDRALLIGTLDDPLVGFFNRFIETEL